MAPKSVTFRRHDHLVSVLFGDLLSHSYNITFSMFLDLVNISLVNVIHQKLNTTITSRVPGPVHARFVGDENSRASACPPCNPRLSAPPGGSSDRRVCTYMRPTCNQSSSSFYKLEPHMACLWSPTEIFVCFWMKPHR